CSPASPACTTRCSNAPARRDPRRPAMNRTLGLIAVSGLGIGVVCLSLAWAIGGRDLRTIIAEDRFAWRSCDDDTVAATGPERRLPWTGSDTIEVVTPVP